MRKGVSVHLRQWGTLRGETVFYSKRCSSNRIVGLSERGGPATVYGLSSEAYAVAFSTATKNIPVSIVDESLGMAMELKAAVVSRHPTLHSLVADEVLLGLEPMEKAIAKAKILFFAPRLRKLGEDVKSDLSSKLREVSKHISKGSLFVYCVPTGIDGNQENIFLLEKQTGFKVGADLQYVYAPLTPLSKTPTAIGLTPKGKGEVLQALKLADMSSSPVASIPVAELLHIKSVVEKSSVLTSELEACRRVEGPEELTALRKASRGGGIYLDDLSEYLFDLRTVAASLRSGDPLLYVASGILKSVEAYTRLLVERVREAMRRREMKASKTVISIVWSADNYEMRGDRLSLRQGIAERLREYVGDVQLEGEDGYTEFQRRMLYAGERARLLIACSKSDVELASKILGGRRNTANMSIVRANLLVEQAGGR